MSINKNNDSFFGKEEAKANSFPDFSYEKYEGDKETKRDIELLNMNRLFNNLINTEITSNNYDQYKKDLNELINYLNNDTDLIDNLEMPIGELLNYVSLISYKLTIVISIRFLLIQLHPEYKGTNILELTGNSILDENYTNTLETKFNEMCISNGKNPQEELNNAIIDKNPNEEEIINKIKSFFEKFNIKKQAN